MPISNESPLVSIGEIAAHLKVSKYLARKALKDHKVPTFYIGKYIAVYPSTLKKHCERNIFIPVDINNTSDSSI